jgi:hypothetical protein
MYSRSTYVEVNILCRIFQRQTFQWSASKQGGGHLSQRILIDAEIRSSFHWGCLAHASTLHTRSLE